MAVEKGEMAVAILDILGFKALMEDLSPEKLYEDTVGQLPEVLEHAGVLERWPDQGVRSLAISDTLFPWLPTGPASDPVPVKGGRVEQRVAIKWPDAHFLKHPRETMRPPHSGLPPEEAVLVEAKIANTATFYERFKSRDPYVNRDGALVLAEFVVPDQGR